MTVSELQVVVGADTKRAESALSSLGAKVGSAGGAIATAFGGAALAGIAGLTAGLGASVAAATSFESQMSAVKAVSGATAGEMAQLQGLALQLGKDTSFSAKEAAQGIEELVKAGISIGDVMGGAASASLSLAAAGAVSVADAAEIAANAMNQFGLQGKDLAGVADLIAGAANASAIDVGDFKFSLAAVGAVANTVGFSFKDTATAIALLGQAGIKGSDAGTSLKTMLLNLQPTTKEQISLFRQLGLITADGANAFFDASGKVKSMAEVAGTLQNALKGMTQQQKLATLETIFGSDAIRAAAVFANEGAEGFNEMAAAMGKVTADEVAKERLNNLKGSVEQLTGSLETAAISAGLKFTPALKGIVDGATALVNDATPGLEAFAARASDVMVEAGRQIGDAWRTMQQALAGDWSPSDQIDPFVNAVGVLTIKAKEAGEAIQTFGQFVADAVAKAGDAGGWTALSNGLDNLNKTVEFAGDRFNELGATFERVGAAAGVTAQPVDVLAAMIRGAALGFEYATVQIDGWVDSALSGINVAVNFATGLSLLGTASQQLARGDIPGMIASVEQAGASFAAGIAAAEDYRVRGLERTGAQATIFGQMVTTGMTQAQASTETSMSAAAAATETNMAQIEAATTTSMAAAVTAVEAAGPQMASAAEAGAASAVSAVAGQAGAAESAGHSVGSSITSGIEGGIMAAAGRLASAAASVVRRAIEAAKSAAGIESPSKVFRDEVGKPIVQGIEQGITETAPALDSTMAGLVRPPRLSAAPTLGGGGFGGGTTVVNVTVQGSLIHERDLEQMVTQAVGGGLRSGARLI